MSRNIDKTTCVFCNSEVKLTEAPRRITKEDCGKYLAELEGMIVAAAACTACEAPYLAWLDGSQRTFARATQYEGPIVDRYPVPLRDDNGQLAIRDLSHRRSFNDEPGPSDYPNWQRIRELAARASTSTLDPFLKTLMPSLERCSREQLLDVLSLLVMHLSEDPVNRERIAVFRFLSRKINCKESEHG